MRHSPILRGATHSGWLRSYDAPGLGSRHHVCSAEFPHTCSVWYQVDCNWYAIRVTLSWCSAMRTFEAEYQCIRRFRPTLLHFQCPHWKPGHSSVVRRRVGWCFQGPRTLSNPHYHFRSERRIYDAKTLLENLNIEPIEYIAKEGLGLINGTSASTALAALAIHDCNSLAIASQVLSAFGELASPAWDLCSPPETRFWSDI